MTLDLTKPITTRNGSPVRIICVDGKFSDGKNIIALITSCGEEVVSRYPASGKAAGADRDDWDLINPSSKISSELWINFYSDHGPTLHVSKWSADKEETVVAFNRTACKRFKIEYFFGEGLK